MLLIKVLLMVTQRLFLHTGLQPRRVLVVFLEEKELLVSSKLSAQSLLNSWLNRRFSMQTDTLVMSWTAAMNSCVFSSDLFCYKHNLRNKWSADFHVERFLLKTGIQCPNLVQNYSLSWRLKTTSQVPQWRGTSAYRLCLVVKIIRSFTISSFVDLWSLTATNFQETSFQSSLEQWEVKNWISLLDNRRNVSTKKSQSTGPDLTLLEWEVKFFISEGSELQSRGAEQLNVLLPMVVRERRGRSERVGGDGKMQKRLYK